MKKRFFTIQIIVFIMLTISLVSSTFSWSRRMYDKVGYLQAPMELKYSSRINGSDCIGKTYWGNITEDGDVFYDMTSGNEITNLGDIQGYGAEAGDVLYFKTSITNQAAVDTNVTLAVNLEYTPSLDGKVQIGCLSPTQDLYKYDTDRKPGYYYADWVPVVSQYEVAANGDAYIEWYIKFEAEGRFWITDIMFANN